jgi:protein O-GlcNAc transferase
MGLPELVTQTQRGYVALAIELATSSAKLKAIKDKLKTNRHSTPLFDTIKLKKHIEDAYVKMYECYQKNSVPVHIYITY